MSDETLYGLIATVLFIAVFIWQQIKRDREEKAQPKPDPSLASMPFEKQTVPLTDAEYRHFRNQYLILMVLPAMFIGIFCATWYFNPPSNTEDMIYATAMGAFIAAVCYYILKHRARTNVMKLVVRGVVCEKKRIQKGKYTSYSMKVGDTTMPVSRGDFKKYELGDLVSMERIDDIVFSRGRLSFIGKTQSKEM